MESPLKATPMRCRMEGLIRGSRSLSPQLLQGRNLLHGLKKMIKWFEGVKP